MKKEDFVTYEQAVKLKDLGFDYRSDYIYVDQHLCHTLLLSYDYTGRDNCISAPTLAQAQKWLRETHRIEVHVCMDFDGAHPKGTWGFEVRKFDAEFGDDIDGTGLSTYEQALSAGIDKALECLKTN